MVQKYLYRGMGLLRLKVLSELFKYSKKKIGILAKHMDQGCHLLPGVTSWPWDPMGQQQEG